MKKLFSLLLCLALLLSVAPVFAFADSGTNLPAFEGKARLLITQDGEVDDMNSLIHALLFIEVGGGANTVARALMSIEAEYGSTADWAALYERICENVILFAWGMQDSCYMDYIQPNWPQMRMIDVSGSTLAYGYRWANVKELSEESRTSV